jgi:hypothetical protein
MANMGEKESNKRSWLSSQFMIVLERSAFPGAVTLRISTGCSFKSYSANYRYTDRPRRFVGAAG